MSDELVRPENPPQQEDSHEHAAADQNGDRHASGESAEEELRRELTQLIAVAEGPLEERLRRLEDSLAQLQDLRAVQAPAPADPPPPPRPLAPRRPSRGLFDLLADLRAMWLMYVDPRYQLSWMGRIVPVILLGAFLSSYYWVPGTSLPAGVGYIINKVADLFLGFFLFRSLIREARRYRENAPDLPPSLRPKG